MTVTRRSFIARAALGPLAAAGLAGPSVAAAATDGAGTLTAYLDTLIPDDELGPGAVRLGVGERLGELAAADRRYRRLLDLGCGWLDEQARALGKPDFAALNGEDRDRVVFRAAEAEDGTLERFFFEVTRRDAFSHYYARPEAWTGIGYDGPPQPVGFPDYSRLPGEPA